MGTQEIFHYPPELMSLLIDTIPLLCRAKKDVILFFRGAGVPEVLMNDYIQMIQINKDQVYKHEIARGVLTRLNEKGDTYLRERREVLRRVVEFENFSSCWDSDVLKAKGLISEIRQLVNVKDSFTKMKEAMENERVLRQKEHLNKIEQIQKRKNEFERIKNDLYSLFSEKNPQVRGKKLEKVLNELFKHYEILIKEDFSINGDNGEGIVEQIDGVIEIDGQIYLVEMKWLSNNVDINDVSRHLVRLYSRANASGIFISTTDYTKAALNVCLEAINQKTIILCKLEEVIKAIEREDDLKGFFKSKIRAAIVDKKPFQQYA
jgi:hypothetical protein